MERMLITFSDGQTAVSGRIKRVTILRDAKRLQVDLYGDPAIRVQGPGVEADAALLNDVRDKEKLPFSVHEK